MSTIEMSLDGYTDLPPGHIANVVTYFEMTEAPTGNGFPLPSGLAIVPIEQPDIKAYRAIYQRIGHEWMWFSRLLMPDAVLKARLTDPNTEVYFLERGGEPVGLCEIRSSGPEVEIAMFGVVREESGSGAAKGFLSALLSQIWSRPTQRVWLHTCTYDHPAAVYFYRRFGFRPFKNAIEITRDPRLSGHLPETAGPHVALIRPREA